MTTAPVPRLIRGLAVPTIISMLVTSFYVMADTYFVGKINTQSTAAVGISFSIMAIIQAFGFFCGHGSGNFISPGRRTDQAQRQPHPFHDGYAVLNRRKLAINLKKQGYTYKR